MKRRFLYLLTTCLLAGVCARAEPSTCGSNHRVVPVNVLDKEGNQVWGLTAADFRAEFRGQPVQMVSVEKDTKPRRVIILLDASGSMMTLPAKWTLARLVAADLATHAPTQFEVSLMAFASQVFLKVTPGEGRKAIAERMVDFPSDEYKKTPKSGRTGLFEAIEEAAEELMRPGDVLYVITDGQDNASHISHRKLEQDLLAMGARVFGFVFAWRGLRLATNQPVQGPSEAYQLFESSGGNQVSFPHDRPAVDRREANFVYNLDPGQRSELAAVVRKLYPQMAEFYGVEVGLPLGVDKARGWKLEVVDAQGKRRKDLTVLYPRKLVPCTDTAE